VGGAAPAVLPFSAELLLLFYGEDLQALARSDVEAGFKAIVDAGASAPGGSCQA